MSPPSRPHAGRRSLLLAAAALPLAAAHAMPAKPAASSAGRILRVGVIDLSFHRASAGIVTQVLQSGGVAHELRFAPHARIYELLGRGEIDMTVSAWLPGSHGGFIRDFEGELLPLGVLYQPYALWGVPDYVPADLLSTVGDLRRADVAGRMTKRIQGIGPGAGISRFSREIVERYNLDAHGYRFENGSLEDCVQAFESAVARGEWVVVALWRPQYLHARHRIRELREPGGLLRGVDDATLVLRRGARALIPDRTLAVLAGMSLGNEVVEALDERVGREGRDAGQVAAEWLAAHGAAVDAWARAGQLALASGSRIPAP